jgi:flavodoxin
LKVLVAYYSETGNTEKVAKAIHDEALKKHQSHLRKIAEITADTLNNYNMVFFWGSPCHSADLALPMKKFLEAIPKSPRSKFAGFFTHSTYTQDVSRNSFDSFASKCAISFENAGKEKQIDFRGNYNCQGAPSPTIKESIRKYFIEVLKSAEGWEEYIKGASKHPSPEDLRKAEEFARYVLSSL